MWIRLQTVALDLAPREVLRLCHAPGTRLQVLHGTLWVTVDHQRADRVLEPGQTFTIESPHTVLAMALGGGVRLRLEQPARVPRRARAGRALQLALAPLRAWWRGPRPQAAVSVA